MKRILNGSLSADVIRRLTLAGAIVGMAGACHAQSNSYPWLTGPTNSMNVAEVIPLPNGFKRVQSAGGSFADWLQHLPLKKPGTPVRLFDGTDKKNQGAQFAVIDLDVGDHDLQQCADTVIRLRAEYLFSRNLLKSIHFDFTSGDTASFTQWALGYRPTVKGNKVQWKLTAKQDSSHASFRSYLETVFMYAGTQSLSLELQPKHVSRQLRIGDVFVHAGNPGHAAIVIDKAENGATAEQVFLLAQGYMPAQDAHVLKNPNNPSLSPWYNLDFGGVLKTPEWEFQKADLKSFKEE